MIKYIIFNSDGTMVATSNYEPDEKDLSSRGEYFVKNELSEDLTLSRVIGGKYGGVWEVTKTPEEILKELTSKTISTRDAYLAKTDWLVIRHNEQKQLEPYVTTLTEDQYLQLLVYRQSLRDITSDPAFPSAVFPDKPEFLE